MQQQIAYVAGHGELRGTSENGLLRFSAIPYASPPVGALRWCAPEPAQWTGPRDATQAGAIAPQAPSRLRDVMGDINASQSEDCLHLTVWTPAVDQRARPVLVWLHGGAWQSGAGALDWYSGARLAARGDVVVVAVNYRLAMLGWLCLAGQTANVGLMDQEAAIQWVVHHISGFGGDPARITVMGQSAGAMSAVCLLTRRPAFDRAILLSAPLGRGVRSLSQANVLGVALLDALQVRDLDAARAAPVEALLHAQQHPRVLELLAAEGQMRSLFGPVADSTILPLDMASALRAASLRADVLVGYTADEMRAFPGLAEDPGSAALGEALFGAASRQWVADAANAGRAAWGFCFSHAPTTRLGACHCIELPFVFGNFEAFASAPMLKGLLPQDGLRLCDALQTACLSFTHAKALDWPVPPAEKNLA